MNECCVPTMLLIKVRLKFTLSVVPEPLTFDPAALNMHLLFCSEALVSAVIGPCQKLPASFIK